MDGNIVIDSRVIIPDLEGRILFLKRASKVANGMWNLPGGKVESMDSVNDTSRKEVMEESGLIVKNLDFLFLMKILEALLMGDIRFHFIFLQMVMEEVLS